MTRRTISAYLGFVLLALALLLTSANRSSAVYLAPPPLPPAQIGLPAEGWQVCRVGEEQTIPGVGPRQVFDLCQGQGWRVVAYCLQPGRPIPVLGASCSMISADTFWCGSGVQELSLYGILETPVPPTRTPTATITETPTPTDLPTETPTVTLTVTQTVIPSGTPSITPPTPLMDTLAVETATPYIRPRPGGPGNAASLLAQGLLAVGMLTAGALTLAAGRIRGRRSARQAERDRK